jgi:hypothetical protein
MSDTVTVSRMPACDFAAEGGCATRTMYDFKTTIRGQWANGCGRHWRKYRAFTTLGTGKGQRLVVDK